MLTKGWPPVKSSYPVMIDNDKRYEKSKGFCNWSIKMCVNIFKFNSTKKIPHLMTRGEKVFSFSGVAAVLVVDWLGFYLAVRTDPYHSGFAPSRAFKWSFE